MGSLLSLHLQATRNRCTGFTSPVTHLQSSPDPSLHEDAVAGLWFRLWILCLHFLKIHSLLWLKVRGVTNLISVRELTLTDFQQQWGWRHFEGYLHKKKTGNLHWKKPKVWLATSFLTWLMAEWLQCTVLPFSAGVEQQFHPLKAKGYENLHQTGVCD